MNKPTPEESLKTMLNLVSDGILNIQDIAIPLQTWVQRYGALDDSKDYVQRFLTKTRGE